MRIPCVGSGTVGPFWPHLQRTKDKTLTRLEWKCLTYCHKNQQTLPSQFFLPTQSISWHHCLFSNSWLSSLTPPQGTNTTEHGIFHCQSWSTALVHLLPLNLYAQCGDKGLVLWWCHPIFQRAGGNSVAQCGSSGVLQKIWKHHNSVLKSPSLPGVPACSCNMKLISNFGLQCECSLLVTVKNMTWKAIIQQNGSNSHSKEMDKCNDCIFVMLTSSTQSTTGYIHEAVNLQHLWAPSMQSIHPSKTRTLTKRWSG